MTDRDGRFGSGGAPPAGVHARDRLLDVIVLTDHGPQRRKRLERRLVFGRRRFG